MLIRRSNLLVPLADVGAVVDAWEHNADAVTLDLGSAAGGAHQALYPSIRNAITAAGRAAAEVFVRVSDGSLTADLEASVWPGLSGIMLRQVETAADVAD